MNREGPCATLAVHVIFFLLLLHTSPTQSSFFIEFVHFYFTARKSSPKVEEKLIEGEPLVYLRFQSGPKAERLAPCAGERGILQLQVRKNKGMDIHILQ